MTRIDRLGWAGLALILAVYAALAFTHLAGLRWNFDEGIAVSQARLVYDGYAMYDPIWTDHTPGQPLLISWAFRLAGISIETARSVATLFGLVALTAVAWTTRLLLLDFGARGAAWLGGLSAAVMLALAPNFWWASRAAMKGVLTESLAALAFALALTYARRRDSRWLVAAGLAMGLSLWIKLQLAYLGPLLALVVLAVRLRRPFRSSLRLTLRDLTLLAVGGLAPVALCLLVYNPQSFIQQVWGTYEATRASYAVSLPQNFASLRLWLTADNWGLLAGALAGILVVVVHPTAPRLIVLLWLAATLVTPLQHGALAIETHFEPILYPLVVLAGVAVGYGALSMLRPTQPRVWLAGLTLFAGLVYGISLPHILGVDHSLTYPMDYDNDGEVEDLDQATINTLLDGSRRNRRAIAFLEANSRPDDFVISEEQILAFYAGRRMPPELAAYSSRRVAIGAISGAEIIEIAERYQPPAIVLWRGGYRQFPEFMAWLEKNYTLAEEFDSGEADGYLRINPTR